VNLMIVEDELRLRSNLALNIPWEENGIEVVGLAASGEEALALFDRKKPDIVLLDIQMPGMNGLELAKRIHDKDPLVKMIILSGHDNFEYARQAVNMGISKYLLKPAGDTEILNAVLEASSELRRYLDQLHNSTLLQEKWEQHLPHLKEMFLLNWLQGKFSPWEISKRSADIMLDISKVKKYCVAVIDMDPLAEDETRFSAKDTSLLQVSLKYICQETVNREHEWITVDTNGSTVIVFTSEEDNGDEFVQYINAVVGKLLGIVKEILKVTASAGISGTADEPRKLSKLYEQAREALRKRIIYGHDIVITHQDRFEERGVQSSYPDIERELEIALETGNDQKYSEALEQLWQSVMGASHTVDEINEGLFYFSSLFVRMIQQHDCTVKEIAGEDMHYLQNLQKFASKEQAYECLSRISRNFLKKLRNKRGSAGHKIVQSVIKMIEENMHEDLTLYTAAEKLYINSSYLSRLFKKETGKSFSAYVLERKMEQAKAMLLQGAKVYDAAASVGYRDVSYFTKVFRKYWGVTPGEVGK